MYLTLYLSKYKVSDTIQLYLLKYKVSDTNQLYLLKYKVSDTIQLYLLKYRLSDTIQLYLSMFHSFNFILQVIMELLWSTYKDLCDALYCSSEDSTPHMILPIILT